MNIKNYLSLLLNHFGKKGNEKLKIFYKFICWKWFHFCNEENMSKVHQFVIYPKWTKDYDIYSQVDQKVFVNTSTRFKEKDYIINNKFKSDIDWKALDVTPIIT